MNVPGIPHTARTRLLTLLTGAACVEILWAIYIGFELPPRYVAVHWNLAWVGLDVAQIAMLLATAWAAWHRRAVLMLYATAAGTLLLVDAWFDITTARRGSEMQSVLFAVLLEVPFAIILFWLTRQTVRQITSDRYENTPIYRVPIPDNSSKPFL
jgi:hypothetical protein